MAMQPGAPSNPFEEQLVMYGLFKPHLPLSYKAFGRMSYMEVTDHSRQKIKNSIEAMEKTVRKTMVNFSNVDNMRQLMEKVIRGVQKYQDRFNLCIYKARTPTQSDFCSDQLVKNIEVDFAPELKKILAEY